MGNNIYLVTAATAALGALVAWRSLRIRSERRRLQVATIGALLSGGAMAAAVLHFAFLGTL